MRRIGKLSEQKNVTAVRVREDLSRETKLREPYLLSLPSMQVSSSILSSSLPFQKYSLTGQKWRSGFSSLFIPSKKEGKIHSKQLS